MSISSNGFERPPGRILPLPLVLVVNLLFSLLVLKLLPDLLLQALTSARAPSRSLFVRRTLTATATRPAAVDVCLCNVVIVHRVSVIRWSAVPEWSV